MTHCSFYFKCCTMMIAPPERSVGEGGVREELYSKIGSYDLSVLSGALAAAAWAFLSANSAAHWWVVGAAPCLPVNPPHALSPTHPFIAQSLISYSSIHSMPASSVHTFAIGLFLHSRTLNSFIPTGDQSSFPFLSWLHSFIFFCAYLCSPFPHPYAQHSCRYFNSLISSPIRAFIWPLYFFAQPLL